MEKFDINKEMAKLKGLNIIEKCSALDDLLDDLEDAQEQIICAKDEISEEYANVFKKKFHEEIASFIAETFDPWRGQRRRRTWSGRCCPRRTRANRQS